MYFGWGMRAVARLLVAGSLLMTYPLPALAQEQEHEHEHQHAGAGGIPMTRDGSGTSWLPDQSPMYAIHKPAGSWMLMLHSSVFLEYLKETGERGSGQAGSINWVMLMAQHKAGAGQVTLRGMLSAEPATIDGCGYPDLLATGEECDGAAIHDRQHPHDVFMELAVQYTRPLGRGVQLQLYGGPAGEPALGPVAFMHRVSALSNPI